MTPSQIEQFRQKAKALGKSDAEINSYLQSKGETDQTFKPRSQPVQPAPSVSQQQPAAQKKSPSLLKESLKFGLSLGLYPNEISKGILKGVASTGLSGARALEKITGQSRGTSPELEQKASTPINASQKVGYYGEKAAEFVAPQGIIAKGTRAIQGITQASKLPNLAQGAANLAGRVGLEGAATFGVSKAQGLDNKEATRNAMIGGALPIAGEAVKQGAKLVPQLLSLTSPLSQTALQRNFQDPKAIKQVLNEVKQKGGLQVFKQVQGDVKNFRNVLTNEYKTGREGLIQEFTGKRMIIDQRGMKLMQKLGDDFALDLPKSNKLSVKEGLDLYAKVNEVYSKRMIQESPQGIPVRAFRDQLRKNLVTNFGGDKGAVNKFLRQYSSRKNVLDAMDDIVNAYESTNPQKITTAFKRLKTAFADDKEAFYETLQQFEKVSGKKVIDKVTALEMEKILPRQIGDISVGEFVRTILLPFFSPRVSGAITRGAGSIANGAKSNIGTALIGASPK